MWLQPSLCWNSYRSAREAIRLINALFKMIPRCDDEELIVKENKDRTVNDPPPFNFKSSQLISQMQRSLPMKRAKKA